VAVLLQRLRGFGGEHRQQTEAVARGRV
jgi:hypothetical protein